MIDIIEFANNDFQILDSSIKKAENLLTTQLGSLAYAADFGVDLNYFLSDKFTFQNEAFKSYLLQRLAEKSIDVSSVLDITETFAERIIFNLAQPQSDNLVR